MYSPAPQIERELTPAEKVYLEIRQGNPEYTHSSNSLFGLEFTKEQQEKLLYYACRHGYLDLLKQLANKYSPEDPHFLDNQLLKNSTTALHEAVKIGNRDIVEYLFDQGVIPEPIKQEVLAKDTSENMPEVPNDEEFDKLGGSSSLDLPKLYPLYWAVATQSPEFAFFVYGQQLLALKNINREDALEEDQEIYTRVDTVGRTPLELAMELSKPDMYIAFYMVQDEKQRLELLKGLLTKYDNDRNFQSFFEGCLEAFFKYGDQESIGYLIDENFVKPDSTLHGKTAVELALVYDKVELLCWLTEEKKFPLPNKEDDINIAALAATQGAINILQWLKDKNGIENYDLLLIKAIKNEQWKTAEWLGKCLIESGRAPEYIHAQISCIAILYNKHSFIHQKFQNPQDKSFFVQDFHFSLSQICEEPEKFDYKILEKIKDDTSLANLVILSAKNDTLKISPFTWAIICGNLFVAKLIATQSSDVLPNINFDYLLLTAALNHHFEVVDFLIKIQLTNQNRNSPFKRDDPKLKSLYVEKYRWLNKYFSAHANSTNLKLWLAYILSRQTKGSSLHSLFAGLVNYAASWNNIENLLWLETNSELFQFPQELAKKTIQDALAKHIEVFFSNCISKNNFDDLKWLVSYCGKKFPELISGSGLKYLLPMVRNDNLEIFQWLVEEQKINITFNTTFKLVYDEISYKSLALPLEFNVGVLPASGSGIEHHTHPPLNISFPAAMICEGRGSKIIHWLIATQGEKVIYPHEISKIFDHCENLFHYLNDPKRKGKIKTPHPFQTIPEVFADLIFISAALKMPQNLTNLYLNTVRSYMGEDAQIKFCQHFEELLPLEKYQTFKEELEKSYKWFQFPAASLSVAEHREEASAILPQENNHQQGESSSSASNSMNPGAN